jgi:hypothetical protein
MPGMKVTVSAAMRARDVSRPRPDHVAAAEENLAAGRPAAPPVRRTGPGRASVPPGPATRVPAAGVPGPGSPRPAGVPGPTGVPGPATVAKPAPPRRPGGGGRPAAEPATASGPVEREPGQAPQRGQPAGAAGQAGPTEPSGPPGPARGGPGQEQRSGTGSARPAKRRRVRRRRPHGR